MPVANKGVDRTEQTGVPGRRMTLWDAQTTRKAEIEVQFGASRLLKRAFCTSDRKDIFHPSQLLKVGEARNVKKIKTVVDTARAIVFIGNSFGAHSASAPDAGSALTETIRFVRLG